MKASFVIIPLFPSSLVTPFPEDDSSSDKSHHRPANSPAAMLFPESEQSKFVGPDVSCAMENLAEADAEEFHFCTVASFFRSLPLSCLCRLLLAHF